MLGRSKDQISMQDIEAWFKGPLVEEDSIYALLNKWGHRLVSDEDFADIYSRTGRPSVSPALLSKVLLLMYHDRTTDREAEERAKYDLRWKTALNIPVDEAGFDYSSLCRFRARLLANEKEKLVFERFISLAKEAGIVKDEALQIIDSTHVLGAAAVKDTYSLIREAIRKMLKAAKHRKALKSTPLVLDYSKKDKEDIDWNDAVQREGLLNKLIKDGRSVLAALKDTELSEEESQAKDSLETIITQDTVEKEDGFTIKQGVAKDRVISAEDPEMRHGRKSSQGKFNGYKADVMMDEKSEIITNVTVSPGNRPDGESLDTMFESSTVELDCVMADTAYGTLEARQTAARYGVNMIAPIPMGGKRSARFSKSDFEIDFENNMCTCPAGRMSDKKRIKESFVSAYIFTKQTCNHCPLRDDCTDHGKGKTITLHPQEQKRREIIKNNNSKEFKELYRKRSKIERKNAHLKQHGMKKTRYLGSAKTLLQLAFTASVINIKRIFTIAKAQDFSNKRIEEVLMLT